LQSVAASKTGVRDSWWLARLLGLGLLRRSARRHPSTASSSSPHHVLRDGRPYRELGGDYVDHHNAQRLTRYHTQQLAARGYVVTLTKSAA
jgi:hypothetical protein